MERTGHSKPSHKRALSGSAPENPRLQKPYQAKSPSRQDSANVEDGQTDYKPYTQAKKDRYAQRSEDRLSTRVGGIHVDDDEIQRKDAQTRLSNAADFS